jgi:hypothetical protein
VPTTGKSSSDGFLSEGAISERRTFCWPMTLILLLIILLLVLGGGGGYYGYRRGYYRGRGHGLIWLIVFVLIVVLLFNGGHLRI